MPWFIGFSADYVGPVSWMGMTEQPPFEQGYRGRFAGTEIWKAVNGSGA